MLGVRKIWWIADKMKYLIIALLGWYYLFPKLRIRNPHLKCWINLVDFGFICFHKKMEQVSRWKTLGHFWNASKFAHIPHWGRCFPKVGEGVQIWTGVYSKLDGPCRYRNSYTDTNSGFPLPTTKNGDCVKLRSRKLVERKWYSRAVTCKWACSKLSRGIVLWLSRKIDIPKFGDM